MEDRIRKNRAEFDIHEMPQGHEERFAAALREAKLPAGKSSGRPRRKPVRKYLIGALSAAALVAVVFTGVRYQEMGGACGEACQVCSYYSELLSAEADALIREVSSLEISTKSELIGEISRFSQLEMECRNMSGMSEEEQIHVIKQKYDTYSGSLERMRDILSGIQHF